MARINPDDYFEKVVYGLTPLWGPFYAIWYLLRLFWAELFRRER